MYNEQKQRWPHYGSDSIHHRDDSRVVGQPEAIHKRAWGRLLPQVGLSNALLAVAVDHAAPGAHPIVPRPSAGPHPLWNHTIFTRSC
jgi:hypothetical protein